jgi:hypothetical protein
VKICYVGNHAQVKSNDDEGAVAYALRQLGHEVICVPEQNRRQFYLPKADLLLFHKFFDVGAIRTFTGPRAFWYFDLVDWKADRTLAKRCAARTAWMRRIIPLVDIGFCTDGDWVAQDASGKLVWLPQGADERMAGHTPPANGEQDIDVLFTGIDRGGGERRESFVREMRERYGERFVHIQRGVHGASLRELVGRAKVAVCPDSPCTSAYWSNRVYLLLGFGAFLLHPYCGPALQGQYADRADLVYYHSRTHLFELIDDLLTHPAYRAAVAGHGMGTTQDRHLYRHRVASLLQTLRERGLVS